MTSGAARGWSLGGGAVIGSESGASACTGPPGEEREGRGGGA